jgi:two-component system sensor histidine kinase/response regulator
VKSQSTWKILDTVAITKENSKYSLLLVDDNQMNRELMAVQLGRQGYKITMAEGGQQALDLLEKTEFDMILLDIIMPGINGLEVLTEVRNKHSLLNLPIIMVTADDGQERIVDAMQKGANDYLIKPLNLPVTVARIKTQLTLKDVSSLKDEFVRFASHDLKKPLIVSLDIIGELRKNCIEGEPISKDTLELFELLQKTGNNMQNVIEGFLDTENLDAGISDLNLNRVGINSIVTKSILANKGYANKKEVELIDELNTDLPEVEMDEFRISQVLDNLIGNAMKFSPPDTKTVVRTHSDNDYIYTEICDSGPGLTEKDLEILFSKKGILSNKPTGNESSTGIGLVISKQLIDQHRGKIGARNNPTKGATFWFGIPIKH